MIMLIALSIFIYIYKIEAIYCAKTDHIRDLDPSDTVDVLCEFDLSNVEMIHRVSSDLSLAYTKEL